MFDNKALVIFSYLARNASNLFMFSIVKRRMFRFERQLANISYRFRSSLQFNILDSFFLWTAFICMMKHQHDELHPICFIFTKYALAFICLVFKRWYSVACGSNHQIPSPTKILVSRLALSFWPSCGVQHKSSRSSIYAFEAGGDM